MSDQDQRVDPGNSQGDIGVNSLMRTTISLFLMFLLFPPLAQGVTDGIAAIVNSEVITLSELHAEVEHETIRLQARFQGKELARRLIHKEYETLNALIERTLQVQEAKVKGFTVTDEELEQALSLLNQTGANGQGGERFSLDSIREELLLRKIQDFEVRRHIMVSREEVRRYYEDFPSRFMEPPHYHLRQILLVRQPETDETEAWARAKELSQELQRGTSFSDLSRRYSDGPEAGRGGDLGLIAHTELLPPLANAVISMKPGEISQPIQTSLGIHILALNSVEPSQPRPFGNVEEDIRNEMFQNKSKEIYQAWLAGLKEKAYIEIKF